MLNKIAVENFCKKRTFMLQNDYVSAKLKFQKSLDIVTCAS
jgi:hypothetical protein